VYQPEIDLHSNAFVGVEALIRWRHPRRGVLSPDAFVPELESSGLILAVDVGLATACARAPSGTTKDFVHCVGQHLGPPVRVERFRQGGRRGHCDESFPCRASGLGILAGHLVGDVSDRLVGLTQLGVRLAIDDFEPGQSLLSDVENLPIRVLKLDRHFVATLSDSPEGTELVHSLVDLAKKSKFQIVASGIEDAEQRHRLQLEEVGVGQGFLFSKPHEQRKLIGT